LYANYGILPSSGCPSSDTSNIIPMYIEELKNDSSLSGWGIWLIINVSDSHIIGDLGFKGKPDKNGVVEIGYGVVDDYRRKGYGYEAVKALTNRAFEKQAVIKIVAECEKDNVPSIAILRRLGMYCESFEEDMLKWELVR